MITEKLLNSKNNKNNHAFSNQQGLDTIAHKEKTLFSNLRAPLPQNIAEKEEYLLRKIRQIQNRQRKQKHPRHTKTSKDKSQKNVIDQKAVEQEDLALQENASEQTQNETIKNIEETIPEPPEKTLSNKTYTIPVTPKRLIIIAGSVLLFVILLINILIININQSSPINAKRYISETNKSDIKQISNVKGSGNIQPLFDEAEKFEANRDYVASIKNRLQGINSYIQMSEYIVALEEAQILSKIFKEQFLHTNDDTVIKLEIYHHNFLSEIYYRLNQPKKALTHSNIALEKTIQFYGPLHFKTAEQYQLKGFNLDNLGQFDEALKMRHKAIDISLQLDENLIDQGQLVTAMNNLGQDYRTLGHFEKSALILKQTINLVEEKYGIDAPELVVILNNLGLTEIENNHKTLALSYLQQSLSLAYRHYGKTHELSQKIAKNITHLRGFRS